MIAATLTTGLTAGLFAAVSYSVMPGLRRTDDRTMVSAMRQINRAILNGWFATCFAGSAVFTALATTLLIGRAPLPWVATGLLLYVATLGITFAVNVPLNNELDASGVPDDPNELGKVRNRFEARWTRWNLVRTVTNVAAFGCLTIALVEFGRG